MTEDKQPAVNSAHANQTHGGKDAVVSEVKKLKQENQTMIRQLDSTFEKVKAERKQRDDLNAKVKEVREKLAPLQKKLNELRKELDVVRAALPKTQSGENPGLLKKELEHLEYRLHTEGSSPAREKAIAKQMKEITAKLKKIESSAPSIKRFRELSKETRELSSIVHELVKELRTLSSQSQSHHEAMKKLLGSADETRTKLSTSLDQLNAKRAELPAEEAETFAPRRQKKPQDQIQTTTVKSEVNLEEVKQRAKKVLEKFKAGETISLEDLQLLQAAKMELKAD